MNQWFGRLSVLTLGLSVAGCGAAVTGAVIGAASSGGGGGGGAVANERSTITSAAPLGDTDGGTVTLEFVVQDDEGDPVEVAFRYSLDPNASSAEQFTDVPTGTLEDVSGGVADGSALVTSAGGETYRFMWNTAQDLGATLNVGVVRVQILIDGDLTFTTNFFSVDNTSSPIISQATLPTLPAEATRYADLQAGRGFIPITVTVLDADSQAAEVDVEFSLDGGMTFPETNVASGVFRDSMGNAVFGTLPTSPGGETYTFEWVSEQNGIQDIDGIVLRFAPEDSKEGDPRDTPAFDVTNADFSLLLDTPDGTQVDRVFAEYLLIDAADGVLDVFTEFSVDGGPFVPCQEAIQPPSEGTVGLRSVPTPGLSHTYVWNAFYDMSTLSPPRLSSGSVVLRFTPMRRTTGVPGQPATTSSFTIDHRLMRTVFNEGNQVGDDATATETQLGDLSGVSVSGDQVRVSTGFDGLVLSLDLSEGTLARNAGGGDQFGDGFPGSESFIGDVEGAVLDALGNTFVLNALGDQARLVRIDAASGLLTELDAIRVEDLPGGTGANGGDGFLGLEDLVGPALVRIGASDRLVVGVSAGDAGMILFRLNPNGAGDAVQLTGGGEAPPTAHPLTLSTGANALALVEFEGSLFLGTGGEGVLRSDDMGATWVGDLVPDDVKLVVPNLAVQPLMTPQLWGATQGGGVVRRRPGGNWELVNGPVAVGGGGSGRLGDFVVHDLAFEPGNPAALLAGTSQGLYRSNNADQMNPTWGRVTLPGGLPEVTALAFGGGMPADVFVGTAANGVFRSVGGGAFTATSTGLGSSVIHDLTRDPVDPTVVYAATPAGVFVFDSGSGTWSASNTGLGSLHVREVLAVPGPMMGTRVLVAATSGAGVFVSTDGATWSAPTTQPSDGVVGALATDGSQFYAGTATTGVFAAAAPGGDYVVAHTDSNGPTGGAAFLDLNQVNAGPVPSTLVGTTASQLIVGINLSTAPVTIAGQSVPPSGVVRLGGRLLVGGNTGFVMIPPPVMDNVPGAGTFFNRPFGVAATTSGDVVFSESGNHRIWRLQADGTARVLAGLPQPGFSGDGGDPIMARLNQPEGLDVDAMGAVLFVDRNNARIRRIAGNVITTVAGTDPPVGDDGPAQASVLDAPCAVLFSGTDYRISDLGNNRVRTVDAATNTITTLAGNGSSGSGGDGGQATAAAAGDPIGLAEAGDGVVYVSQGFFVRRVRTDGVIEVAVGSGQPGNGFVAAPVGGPPPMPMDPSADPDGGPSLGVQIGGPNAFGLDFDEGPAGLALRGDALLIADPVNAKVWAANVGANPIVVAGVTVPAGETRRVAGDSQGATDTTDALTLGFELDEVVAVDWFVDGAFATLSRCGVLLRIETDGTVTTLVDLGDSQAEGVTLASGSIFLCRPSSMLIDERDMAHRYIYVVEDAAHRVRALKLDGGADAQFGVTFADAEIRTIAGPQTPAGDVSVFFEGSFSGDTGPATRARFNLFLDGNALSSRGGRMALDADGGLLIPDTFNDRIRRVDDDGTVTTVAGGGLLDGDGSGAAVARLNNHIAVAVDPTGAEYVTFDSGRVRRVDPQTTTVTTVAGSGANAVVTTTAPGPATQQGFRFFERDLGEFGFPFFFGTADSGDADTITISIVGDEFDFIDANVQAGMAVFDEADPSVNALIIEVVGGDTLELTPNADGVSWAGRDFRVQVSRDFVGPRGLSLATLTGDMGNPTRLVAVADSLNHAIRITNVAGDPITLQRPAGAVTLPPGQMVAVLGDGTYGTLANDRLQFPGDVQLLPNGIALIANTVAGTLVGLNLTGDPITFAGVTIPGGAAAVLTSEPTMPIQATADVNGNLIWSDLGRGGMIPEDESVKILTTGSPSYGLGSSPTAQTVLAQLDPMFPTDTEVMTPRGVSADLNGNLYVVDSDRQVVFGIASNGEIEVVAGTLDIPGLSGDGGLGSTSLLNSPYDVAANEQGVVWIIDGNNRRIRRTRRFP